MNPTAGMFNMLKTVSLDKGVTHSRHMSKSGPMSGNEDLEGLTKAIEEAKSVTDKPSIIKVTYVIWQQRRVFSPPHQNCNCFPQDGNWFWFAEAREGGGTSGFIILVQ